MSLKNDFTNIKVLHIEPTTKCNAACPQCLRTISKFTPAELSFSKIKKLVSTDFIKQLDKMFMCGVLGDPAAAKDTIKIFEYFKNINPEITLGMNTNGGIRNPNWWIDLAKILNDIRDYVIFSIDGLADTNHIYRINVKWNKVMKNSEAFINAGGNAHWDMLTFAHNEHQVGKALQTAKEMGFTCFRSKVSKRHASFPVNGLNPPKNWAKPIALPNGKINCHALSEKSVYLSAAGIFYPCCFMAETKNTVEEFKKIQENWGTPLQNTICTHTCTQTNNKTAFIDQWTNEVFF